MTIGETIILVGIYLIFLAAWVYAVICNYRLRRKIQDLDIDLECTKIAKRSVIIDLRYYKRLTSDLLNIIFKKGQKPETKPMTSKAENNEDPGLKSSSES